MQTLQDRRRHHHQHHRAGRALAQAGGHVPGVRPELGAKHLAEMDPVVFDPASGRMVITYQTFMVRTPKHTVLVDTCTGEDKGYPPPMDFPKQPWLDNFAAAGLRFEDIDYVFCTHLHIDHTGWNTRLRDGRWVPTFPNAKYIFHKGEYAYWEEATKRGANPPGNVWTYNCGPSWKPAKRCWSTTTISSTTRLAHAHAGAFATPLLRRHPLPRAARGGHGRHDAPCAPMPGARTGPRSSTRMRRWLRSPPWFPGKVADTATFVLPIHFPDPTVGRVAADGERFRYNFVR